MANNLLVNTFKHLKNYYDTVKKEYLKHIVKKHTIKIYRVSAAKESKLQPAM